MLKQPKDHAYQLNNLVPQPKSEEHRPSIIAAGPAKDMGSELNEEDRQSIREWAPGFKKKHEKTFRLLAG